MKRDSRKMGPGSTGGKVVLLLLVLCVAMAWARPPARTARPATSRGELQGLQFRLSSALAAAEGRTPATKQVAVKPLPADLTSRLLAAPPRSTTDGTGVATLDLPDQAVSHRLLVATQGSDVAFLPQDKYWWNGGDKWQRRPRLDTLRWCVFDDRGIYKGCGYNSATA